MKITSLGFQREIKTDLIRFSVLEDSKITSCAVKFKVSLFSNQPIYQVVIGDEPNSILIEHWFSKMLAQKLILTEPSNAQNYFDEHLFVKDVNLPYITQTLFQILEKLLSKNLTLLSLEII